MKYRGYFSAITYNDDFKTFHGEVLGIQNQIFFTGKSVEELEIAFHKAIDEYLEKCRANGVKPEKAFSGKFNLRLSPNLHATLAIRARLEGLSLNQYVKDILTRATR